MGQSSRRTVTLIRTIKSKKKASSDTLMATYDAKDIVAERQKLVKRADAFLATLPGENALVGIAYAIAGEVRGARWFISHNLFDQHRDKLLHTAAAEAVTAKERAGAKPAPKAIQVRGFIDDARKAKVKNKRQTKSMNENVYRENDKAFSAEAVVEEDGVSIPVTFDVLAK